jgi:Na+-translocating ferredoxin:NAD+ oxidoreductase RnfC subunit
MALRDDVRRAGVLGAGGAAFPAHVKYARPADVLIINGVECEPLSRKDEVVLETRAADVVTAAAALREELGARDVVLAVKADRARVLAPLYGGLRLHPLADCYPQGDEMVLTYDVTGRRVPAAGIPPDVGVVVANAETVMNVARALRGRVVTTTWVTVAGAVREPFVAEVPVGTPAARLLAEAGGVTDADAAVFDGGPMMGEEIDAASYGVGLATGVILALPRRNVVVERARQPLAHVRTIAGSACTQCRDCTELCPRYLLGYDVTPHLSMRRFFSWGEEAAASWFANAAGCTGCGLCELYACPMAISPRRVQLHLKKSLVEPARREGTGEAHADRDGRRVPSARLKRRLDVVAYDRPAPVRTLAAPVSQVRIPLAQPYAAELRPAVREGDRLELGQLIASPAPGDERGVPVYASLAGRVAALTTATVVIDGGAA